MEIFFLKHNNKATVYSFSLDILIWKHNVKYDIKDILNMLKLTKPVKA